MKKHNASKVALITILVLMVLTWILPAATYSGGTYNSQGRAQMGLYYLLYYFQSSISNFLDIAVYLILVGGFYGILYKIPAYRSFLDAIVKCVKGKEKLALAVIVLISSLMISVGGVQVAYALFVPFIVSLVLLMGYDKIVAGLVIIGSISAGLLGSTYGGSNLAVLTGVVNIQADYQLLVRFAILLVAVIVLIFNIFMYIKYHFAEVKITSKPKKEIEDEDNVVAHRVEVPKKEVKSSSSKSTKSSKKSSKKSSSKSRRSDNKAALKEEEVIVVKETLKEDKFVPAAVKEKHTVWPFAVLFGLLFSLFVLAFLPWDSFKVDIFTKATKSVQEFQLYKFPIFAKLLGIINPFGNWSNSDMFLPILLSIIIVAVIYKVKIKDLFENFVDGAKEAVEPAVMVLLIYTVVIILYYHSILLPIYKIILGWSKGFNIITTTLVAFLSGLFNADMAFSFQSALPYYISVVTDKKVYDTVAVIFQTIIGLTTLVAPTSLTLMVALSYLKVSYVDWLKNVWKLLVELLAILLIVFIVLSL